MAWCSHCLATCETTQSGAFLSCTVSGKVLAELPDVEEAVGGRQKELKVPKTSKWNNKKLLKDQIDAPPKSDPRNGDQPKASSMEESTASSQPEQVPSSLEKLTPSGPFPCFPL